MEQLRYTSAATFDRALTGLAEQIDAVPDPTNDQEKRAVRARLQMLNLELQQLKRDVRAERKRVADWYRQWLASEAARAQAMRSVGQLDGVAYRFSRNDAKGRRDDLLGEFDEVGYAIDRVRTVVQMRKAGL